MGPFKGFTKVKVDAPQRSTFDLSNNKRVSMQAGTLYPVCVYETLPSDTFHGSTEILLRLAPLLAPIYDQLKMYVHFFFIPWRLLYENWEDFITGGRLGPTLEGNVPTQPFTLPYFDMGAGGINGNSSNSLLSYLGVPDYPVGGGTPADYDGIQLCAGPVLAYQLVWYEYYRDRNFQADDIYGLEFPFPDGEIAIPIDQQIISFQPRFYAHDYFTSALPFTQRGDDVMLPISVSGYLPLVVNPLSAGTVTSTTISGLEQPGGVSVGYGGIELENDPLIVPNGDIMARLDQVSSQTSINDFRAAYALQVWMERNAVAGSRYTESNLVHFKVKPQDSRLQRPEYIGGGVIPVRISEVVAMANSVNSDANTVPQGNLAGRGLAYGNTNDFKYFCAEHGYIIGIASILPQRSYQEGLPRMFMRRSFLDFPWPTFAKLGEQRVYKYELYATAENLIQDDTPPNDGDYPLFGYQSRYADWKWVQDTNAGDFRSNLNFWTFTTLFSDNPELGVDFLTVNLDDVNKVFATTAPAADPFWAYVHNNCIVRRPLPYFGSPNTLGFV